MLGSRILYLKGMGILMFQLSGFYCNPFTAVPHTCIPFEVPAPLSPQALNPQTLNPNLEASTQNLPIGPKVVPFGDYLIEF